jgi:hypothetical protein
LTPPGEISSLVLIWTQTNNSSEQRTFIANRVHRSQKKTLIACKIM